MELHLSAPLSPGVVMWPPLIRKWTGGDSGRFCAKAELTRVLSAGVPGDGPEGNPAVLWAWVLTWGQCQHGPESGRPVMDLHWQQNLCFRLLRWFWDVSGGFLASSSPSWLGLFHKRKNLTNFKTINRFWTHFCQCMPMNMWVLKPVGKGSFDQEHFFCHC